eukprot:gene13023-17455_t
MPLDLQILNAVNCSIGSTVIELAVLLENLTGARYDITYSFYHNDIGSEDSILIFSDENSTSLENTSSDDFIPLESSCRNNTFGLDCHVINCNDAVIREASIWNKKYISYFSSVILDYVLDLNITHYFGFNPIISSIDRFLEYDTTTNVNNENIMNNSIFEELSIKGIEFGGGSGFGFQIYCDNIMIITGGAGGGGGLEYHRLDQNDSMDPHNKHDLSFGGGGGGGIQFRSVLPFADKLSNENISFVSIGGGSGCGSCDIDSENNDQFSSFDRSCNHQLPLGGNVHQNTSCGVMKDDDALSNDNMQNLLTKNYNHTSFLTCNSISLYGGGGGGGGTAECCQPFHIGYGFAMNMISLPRNQTNQTSFIHYMEDVNTLHLEDMNHNDDNNTQSSEDANPNRFKYDFMGKILHIASLECKGGYENWCCVCSIVSNNINNCIHNQQNTSINNIYNNMNYNNYNNNNNKIENNIHKKWKRRGLQAVEDSNLYNNIILPNVTCDDIQSNLMRISWLSHNSCGCDHMNNNKQTDNNNNTNDNNNNNSN